MSSPLQGPDFFILEATEALDDLDAALRGDDPPAPDHLLRAVRLLRGAALMAGQQPMARVGMVLETIARAHREQPASWTTAMHDQLRRAASELRALVGRVRAWTEADTARILQLGRTLELLGEQPRTGASSTGSPAAAVPAGAASAVAADRSALEAGVRAFVAREGALIASALDRAARTARTSPSDREPLYTVIRRMQSLRGLAELSVLAPLPQVLDAIELAIGDLTRSYAPPPAVHEFFDAASRALTRLARDIAGRGRPDAESAEVRRFAELLIPLFAVERDVVPIETLYRDGDPEPVQLPAATAGFRGSGTLGPLEIVSHGEHLTRAADLLAHAASSTERDLRLYQLLGTLRTVIPAAADPIGSALGAFTEAIRATLAGGDESTARLAQSLETAGQLLRQVADGSDRTTLSGRLLEIARQLRHPDAIGTAEPSASGDDADVVPIEQLLLPDPAADIDDPIVPIESLAPDGTQALQGATGIERTFRTYARLQRERRDDLPSLTAFLRTAPAPSPSSPHGPSTADATPPVAIEELCYRGRSALARAAAVRDELQAALAASEPFPAVRPLLDELLDLIPLAAIES